MKRHLAWILALVMAFSMLTACGGTEKAENLLADKTLEEILAAIYEEKKPEMPLMENAVDLTDPDATLYCTGLSKEDTEMVEEVLVSEPAMGSQAYSLVLLRVKDENDAEAVASAVKNGIDPRKWICVEADDLRACASGDVVMFVMMSTVFADTITCDQVVEAFKTVAGGNLSVDLK